MKLILRPLMPPCSLMRLKYAASSLPMVPYADAGPLYGMVCPILISVSVAPGSYFFCAIEGAASARPSAATARVVLIDMMVLSLDGNYGNHAAVLSCLDRFNLAHARRKAPAMPVGMTYMKTIMSVP